MASEVAEYEQKTSNQLESFQVQVAEAQEKFEAEMYRIDEEVATLRSTSEESIASINAELTRARQEAEKEMNRIAEETSELESRLRLLKSEVDVLEQKEEMMEDLKIEEQINVDEE